MNYEEMVSGLKTGDNEALIEVVCSYNPIMLTKKGYIYNVPGYGSIFVPVDIYNQAFGK